MAKKSAPFIKETSSSAGTGDIVLTGAAADHYAFSTRLADGDTCDYFCVFTGGFFYATGTYTLATTTLSRDTVLFSSEAADANPTLPAGDSEVFMGAAPGHEYSPRNFHSEVASNLLTIRSGKKFDAAGDSVSSGTLTLDTAVASVFHHVLTETVDDLVIGGTAFEGQEVTFYIEQDASGSFDYDEGATFDGISKVISGDSWNDNSPYSGGDTMKTILQYIGGEWKMVRQQVVIT